MAKLLCSVLLAVFALQANAFSVRPDPPNPEHTIPRILNPVNWFPNISNPLKHLPNPLNWIRNIPNPLRHLPNPLDWIRNIPNPFTYVMNLDYHKLNPFYWISRVGKDRCLLQADKGHCDGNETRYYYDKNIKACIEFEYGGCKGNRNNFVRKHDCEKACRGH